MNIFTRIFVVFFTMSALAGCVGDKPSRVELSNSLGREAINNLNRSTSVGTIRDNFITVYNFKTISSENIGNKVTPKIVGRFTANIRLNEDAYSGDAMIPNTKGINAPLIYSVSVNSEKNHVSVFSGVYEANVNNLDSNGKKVWRIWFKEFEAVKNDFRGVPLRNLGPLWVGQTEISKTKYYHVLKGSTDEQAVFEYFETLEQKAKDNQIKAQAAVAEKKKQAQKRAETVRQARLTAKKEGQRIYQNNKNKWVEQVSSNWNVKLGSFDSHNNLYENCFKINTFFSGGKPTLSFAVPHGIKVNESKIISAKIYDPKLPEKWLSHDLKAVLRYNGQSNYMLLTLPDEPNLSLSSSATPNENCDVNSVLGGFQLVGKIDKDGKKYTHDDTFRQYK